MITLALTQIPCTNTFDADSRLSASQAGYMELAGAKKDADCHKVNVEGGVSSARGCCNEFQAFNSAVEQFRCGQCKFLRWPK